MADPATLIALGAAVGGVSGKLVENTWDLGAKWIANYFSNHRDRALQQAEENGARFLVDLAQRVRDLEERLLREEGSTDRIAEALSDPDVAASLQASLIAAARTSDPQKHDVLARAVAQRISAASDSLPALAANIAIEAVARLSAHHLRILALTAVIYTIRSPGLPLVETPAAETDSWQATPDERQALAAYVPWLENAVAQSLPSDAITAADYVHLASTNCLVVEHGVERDLEAVLRPYRQRLLGLGGVRNYYYAFQEWFFSLTGRKLLQLWDQGLQRVALTPAGLLLGTSVFDHAAGTVTSIDWTSSYITSSPEPVDLAIWDGREIHEKFLKTLDKEIQYRIERGVSPWNGLERPS